MTMPDTMIPESSGDAAATESFDDPEIAFLFSADQTPEPTPIPGCAGSWVLLQPLPGDAFLRWGLRMKVAVESNDADAIQNLNVELITRTLADYCFLRAPKRGLNDPTETVVEETRPPDVPNQREVFARNVVVKQLSLPALNWLLGQAVRVNTGGTEDEQGK